MQNKQAQKTKTAKITIDELATMIKNGFDEADRNLKVAVKSLEDKLTFNFDTKLLTFEKKLTLQMREGFYILNDKLDALADKFTVENKVIKNRLTKLEAKC